MYTLHVPLQSFPPLSVIPADLGKERDKAKVILLHVSESTSLRHVTVQSQGANFCNLSIYFHNYMT